VTLRSPFFRRPSRALIAALLLVSPDIRLAAQGPGAIGFERYNLPNGLEVILAEDHAAPVVAVDIWYRAGSRYEQPGHTGLARLFERLMFTGTTNAPAGEYARRINQAGGQLSAEVLDDVSRFGNVLPSDQLPLGLWLEADRMRGLGFSDSVFQLQRDAAIEERQSRIDTQPYSAAFLSGIYTAYDSATCFGYAHPPVGSVADLNRLTLADAQQFYQTYYVPKAARLVVAGDFDPATAKRLIGQMFGGLAGGEPPARPVCAGADTPKAAGAPLILSDQAASLAAAGLFFRVPEHGHADTPALDLLAIILARGQTSLLRARLSRDARLAAAAQADIFVKRDGPSVFGLFLVASEGVSADSLQHRLAEEIDSLPDAGLTAADLARARQIYTATVISSRQRMQEIGESLQHAAAFHQSPDAVNSDLARYQAVSLDDLRRVARTYLRPELAKVIMVNPGGAS
jgi:predicted Zn-dependent peptidase